MNENKQEMDFETKVLTVMVDMNQNRVQAEETIRFLDWFHKVHHHLTKLLPTYRANINPKVDEMGMAIEMWDDEDSGIRRVHYFLN